MGEGDVEFNPGSPVVKAGGQKKGGIPILGEESNAWSPSFKTAESHPQSRGSAERGQVYPHVFLILPLSSQEDIFEGLSFPLHTMETSGPVFPASYPQVWPDPEGKGV